ncbi:thiol peroxidase [Rothia sp. ZJ932]|uniref:thiol peroxidase n=1 Tax=Rothia sp. ZJ932 TaxID=2810516 RepID=UPI001968826C|nr:thiol peroxidase [Rothia sp. ZJ932]QRZ62168.1 thiol peroxidase [Rothia sp. ZJ932]
MADITFDGTPVHTTGELPAVGSTAPAFLTVNTGLEDVSAETFAGKKIVLNIFPSVDTGICAQSVRQFNEEAAGLENTVVVSISQDLPFALGRFCGAEGIENVVATSAFRSSFGQDYGVTMTDGPLKGLLARSVVIINEGGEVTYTQLVPEIKTEPDYEAALKALK